MLPESRLFLINFLFLILQVDANSNGPITAPMMSEMLAANQPVVVDDTNIINVWRDNLEQAFKDISEIVQTVAPALSLHR
jgi:hypothetical protein